MLTLVPRVFLRTPLMTSSLAAMTQEGGQEDMNSIPETDRAHLQGGRCRSDQGETVIQEVPRSFHLA